MKPNAILSPSPEECAAKRLGWTPSVGDRVWAQLYISSVFYRCVVLQAVALHDTYRVRLDIEEPFQDGTRYVVLAGLYPRIDR